MRYICTVRGYCYKGNGVPPPLPPEHECGHAALKETPRRRWAGETGRSGKSQSPTSRGVPDGPAGLLPASTLTTLLAVRSIESRIVVQS